MAVQTFTLANQSDVGELSTIQLFTATGTMTASGTALVTNGATNITLNLPSSTQIAVGQCVTVKKTDTGAGTITVTPPSGTIDASATLVIAGGARNKNTVLWDGTNWWTVV